MFEFNLRRETPQAERRFDASEFSIQFPKEMIEQLKDLDPKELQKQLNALFTQERRDRMIQKASTDPSGRKVRYYRAIRTNRLYDLLEQGNDASRPENESPERIRESLLGLYQKYLFFLEEEKEISYELSNKISNKLFEKDSETILKTIFPQMPSADRTTLLECASLSSVREVLKRYLPNKLKQQVHTGSAEFQLTDYISMSTGGVINTVSAGRSVYLEVVMDDQDIIIPGYSCEGEKEVLTKSIALGNISKVFVTYGEMEELITGKDSAIKQAIEASPRKNEITDEIEVWRWGTSRNDYLPVSLQGKAKRSETYGHVPHKLK
jgi:hypothetical protein